MKLPTRKQVVDLAMKIYPVELAHGAGYIYDDYPKAEVRKLFEGRAEIAFRILGHLTEEKAFTIYREIETSVDRLDTSRLGIYWAILPEKAIAYWGKKRGKRLTIQAIVKAVDVDWKTTAALMAMHGEKEIEIRLRPGAKVLVSGVNFKPPPPGLRGERFVLGSTELVLGYA